MEKYFNSVSKISAIIGGLTIYLLGGWDTLIQVLIILMVLDYVTGILKGLYIQKLSSKTGRQGIIKKLLILILVAVSVMCEKIGIPAMREMTIMFFAVNESISILENSAEMGIPIPQKLKSSLLQIREVKEEKNENN